MYNNCANCSGRNFSRCPTRIIAHREIMVIGEMPTPQEIKTQNYIDGPAAQILKQTMRKVGLPTDVSKVWYTTALKCAVPKRKGKSTPIDTLRNCRSTIIDEIKNVNPKIVILLGKNPTQCVLNDFKLKITAAYGRATTIPELGDIKLIPVLHPALIMRTPKDYKPFLASLELIADLYKTGKIEEPNEVKWKVTSDDKQFDSMLQHLKQLGASGNLPYVGNDIETTDLDYRFAEFCVLGVAINDTECYVIPREMRHRIPEIWEVLKNTTRCIWHHGKYDTKVMWRRGLGNVPLDEDTIYQHYVFDETSAHDLGSLTKIFLHAPDYKYKMNQNFKAVTLETYDSFFESLCERVAVDCCYTLQLNRVFHAELAKDKKLDTLYNTLIMPAARFLSRVEQNGMKVNPKPLEIMDVEYDKVLEDIMNQIHDLAKDFWDPQLYMEQKKAKTAPDVFNPGSPKQMSWMVFNRLGLKPRIRKGDSTNADVLSSIEPAHPLIDLVLKYRGVKKEQSTYVKGLLKRRDEDGRVRSNFSLHITATGRLSSKEPNVQNIPSYFGVGNVRRAFIPDDGKILMEVDYSGAELRWLACLSNDKVLKDIFIEGRNLHDETATALFGPNFTKQDRMRAKAVNFGIPYGREAQSLAEEFNISIEEAQEMINNWLNAYPGAKRYLQQCADAVVQGNYLETPFFRRRRFGLVTKESLHALQNEARNMPIQSSSSDTLLLSAMYAEDTLKEKYDTKIINLIHDSMLLEVPADPKTVQAVSQYVSGIMKDMPVRLFNLDVPFAVDTDLGPTWGDFAAYDNETGTVEVKVDGKKQNIKYEDWAPTVGISV